MKPYMFTHLPTFASAAEQKTYGIRSDLKAWNVRKLLDPYTFTHLPTLASAAERNYDLLWLILKAWSVSNPWTQIRSRTYRRLRQQRNEKASRQPCTETKYTRLS